MDDYEVNASSFPELMYAHADALITLAKQSKIKEKDIKVGDISQCGVRYAFVLKNWEDEVRNFKCFVVI